MSEVNEKMESIGKTIQGVCQVASQTGAAMSKSLVEMGKMELV